MPLPVDPRPTAIAHAPTPRAERAPAPTEKPRAPSAIVPAPTEKTPAPTEKTLAPTVRAPAPSIARERPRIAVDGDAVARWGDRAGEHRRMARGHYDAWVHVIIAFAIQLLAIGALVGGGAAALVSLALGHARVEIVLVTVGGAAGAIGAWLVFRDRWRCIEAFASRFCSGMMNLSILYVPAVALLYANYRAIRKLRGR